MHQRRTAEAKGKTKKALPCVRWMPLFCGLFIFVLDVLTTWQRKNIQGRDSYNCLRGYRLAVLSEIAYVFVCCQLHGNEDNMVCLHPATTGGHLNE